MFRSGWKWAVQIASDPDQLALNQNIRASNQNIGATIAAVWTLALSLLVGYIAAYIYDQSQQDKDG
jgi:hypothetical protein